MNYGFTLIELLLAIALLSIFAGLGSYFGISAYVRSLSMNDAELLLAALERARAESQADICGENDCLQDVAHGVHVRTNVQEIATSLTVFEGSSYASRDVQDDITLPLSGETLFDGPNEIMFSPGGAHSIEATMILELKDLTHTTHVSVDSDGAVTVY
jgi:prepilin-type N-terminal cleavage/methylation domain-containing protein